MWQLFFMYFATLLLLIIYIVIYLIKDNKEYIEVADVLLNNEELFKHAREIGRIDAGEKSMDVKYCLLNRLDRNFEDIEDIYLNLNEEFNKKRELPKASEWLLDNFYIVELQYKMVRQNLEREKKFKLRTLTAGPLKGYPRVYRVALELISHSEGIITEENIIKFINFYQRETILSIKEISALSLMFTLALMEYVRNISIKTDETQRVWKEAEEVPLSDIDEIEKYIDKYGKVNTSFIEHLLKRVKKEKEDGNLYANLLEKKITYLGTDIKTVLEKEYKKQGHMKISIGNGITSLKSISNLDWNYIFESLCVVEKILKEDPMEVYQNMDKESKNYYRYQVEKLAEKLNTQETFIARKAIELAKEENDKKNMGRESHVGYYILDKGRKKIFESLGYTGKSSLMYLNNSFLYIIPIVLLSLLMSGILARYGFLRNGTSMGAVIFLTVFIPFMTISTAVVNEIYSKVYKPKLLPKIEFKEGIPEKCKTFLVIPTLITNKKRVKELAENLETHYLSNKEKNIYFGIIGDFADSEKEEMEDDHEITEEGLKWINKLNEKYAGDENIFYYFHRRRVYSKTEGKWTGWERKRGALVEFNNLISGEKDTTFYVISGNVENLTEKIKYVITLDADTKIPIGGVNKLVGTISHPLNSPEVYKYRDIVREGFGIIQPRITVNMESANKSLFTRIYAGHGGIDPYTTSVSNVYQDVFGEGIFTGKGIYDINAFQQGLKDKIPENSILSHDLIEGIYLGAGLASDIELVDEYPWKYNSYIMRQHRWVRGDWQLIKFLFSRDRSINAISRWKIWDNMRRSISPIATMLTLILGIIIFPGNKYIWIGISLISLFMPFIIGFIESILYRNFRISMIKINGNIITGWKGLIYQGTLSFMFLPYESYMMADAIIRTLCRVFITKKNLIQWTTAFDVEKELTNDIKSYFKLMNKGVLISVLTLALVYILNPHNIWIGLIISFLWFISPIAAFKISNEDKDEKKMISEKDLRTLRRISRKTWNYYEEFTNEENNFIPPDNFQEYPYNGLAYRTSPTNIGFYLLAVLSARDFGYISTKRMIDLIEKTIYTINKMDKWEGHLYNWYGTLDLKPLRPYFISTVDSGNFVAYLIVLKEGIKEYLNRPFFEGSIIDGFIDTGVLIEDNEVRNLILNEFNSVSKIREKELTDIENKFIVCKDNNENKKDKWLENSIGFIKDLKAEYTEFFSDSNIEDTFELKPAELVKYYEELINEEEAESDSYKDLFRLKCNAEDFIERCKNLIDNIEHLISETKFKPLYDNKKCLFSVGYNVEDKKIVNSYYDLLASEARTASYISLSRGEVPADHWFKLGRPLVMKKGFRSLASWAGTMFEYLMPALTMKSYKNTLLDETYKTSVKIHIDYGTDKKIPWGISESCFFAFDSNLNYQYKAFGVPFLGFKRGLKDNTVVSPYSTILSLNINYEAALENIRKLIEENLEGEYGFFESIDYTYSRLPMNMDKAVVKSYMTHHQGMIFVSIDNFLKDNSMVKRFHRDPEMKCGELFLQEKIPLRAIVAKETENLIRTEEKAKKNEMNIIRRYDERSLSYTKCHVLSSGDYSLMITNRGSGFSKKGDIYINRWREDFLTKSYGNFVYISDLKRNKFWSNTYEPTNVIPEKYKVEFSNHKVDFYRLDGDIETKTEIVLLPEEEGEVRKITIKNIGNEDTLIEITSYLELVGDKIENDITHSVFNNLFIKTEICEEIHMLLGERRKRNKNEEKVWVYHMGKIYENAEENFQYETNRLNFVGRGKNLRYPNALSKGLTNTAGVVLDPIMSIGKRVKIKGKESITIYFLTGITDTKENAVNIGKKYSDQGQMERSLELAYTRSQTEIGYLNLKSNEIRLYQDILNDILLLEGNSKRRYDEIIRKNEKGQNGLWAYGISGDLPLVLVVIKNVDGIDNLKTILRAHEYWTFKGIKIDLLILIEDGNSYYQPLLDNVRDMVYEYRGNFVEIQGGIFIQNGNDIPLQDKGLFYKWANIVIDSSVGYIKENYKKVGIPYKKYNKDPIKYDSSDKNLELRFFNGYGGFSQDGREYIIKLNKDINTPLPWINVISNDKFGFIVSERGSSFTWADNSRENKLTPWYNDLAEDPSGEIIYIRDEETGHIWNITPGPIRENEDYIISHGMGYTNFYHDSNGMEQNLTMFVSMEDNIKINYIKIKNNSPFERKLSLAYFARPVLGVEDGKERKHVETYMDEKKEIFYALNSTNSEFRGSTLYMGSSEKIKSYTGDRKEFLGSGSFENPEGMKRDSFSNMAGIGMDPCCVINIDLTVPSGKEKELVFLIGESKGVKSGRETISKYKDIGYSKMMLEKAKYFWTDLLTKIQIETPDESMNLLMNNFLLYQTIACRLWARAGFYQVGGAYGARDQIQDSMNCIYVFPELTRKQIILNCRHQFLEGDIQHWWHPDPYSDVHKGIRSKCSDDLLWLPYVLAEYVKITEDYEILNEKVYFIESMPLNEEEYERYEIPDISNVEENVYEHCVKAIEKSLVFGERGLPLMGSGDWNDGMNRVGFKGKGESVWLGWFLISVLEKFIPICEKMNDKEKVSRYKGVINDIKYSIEKNCWDGDWYLRAFFDDGTPIGSKESSECIIDSISQSWAVISGMGDWDRIEKSLNSLEKYLINEDKGMILLFTPPFDNISEDPGYIKSYVPGVRENGGQYTHGAIWVISAFAKTGKGDRTYELFHMINPINHSRSAIECSNYKVEPYVMAADVYNVNPHVGRGGWTWYTGSAGWMYKVGLEDILGFKKEGNRLYINPCIPRKWDKYTIKYRYKNTRYNILIKNPYKVNRGVNYIMIDGNKIAEKYILLQNDGGEHLIEVILGSYRDS